MPRFAPLSPQLLAQLREIVGENGLLTQPAALQRYGRDETEALLFRPEAVALPSDTAQVSRLLAVADSEGVPVTPRGAGTGLSGGALPVHGGLVLSLERLCRIRGIDSRNLTAEVEAGVVTGDLQRRVEELGLFYPPDPASSDSCQIGGNIAEDSAGPRSCKYGSTRRWVMGLEAVLADGSILHTGGANRKDVTGYNLTQLLIGAEGTLAVVTAATLRLISLPAVRLTIAVPFDELERAAEAVHRLFLEGHDPAACELLEAAALRAVASLEAVPAQLAERQALLLLELDGDRPGSLLGQAGEIADLCQRLGGGEALVASEGAEQRRLWRIRERVGEAVRERSVYKEADAVVPRAALAELVRAARRAAGGQGLEAICYGHAGDGNLHVNLLRGDLDEVAWNTRRDAAETELYRDVVELGGTISGEHGIGWTQRRHLDLVLDPATLRAMRGIKRLFDPRGILNPGKIFPDP